MYLALVDTGTAAYLGMGVPAVFMLLALRSEDGKGQQLFLPKSGINRLVVFSIEI
jgi:hypothetical protein